MTEIFVVSILESFSMEIPSGKKRANNGLTASENKFSCNVDEL